ncbi:MAG: hypothetical protein RLZZ162_3720 [Verrucomicrobiota bacterium]|jgi:hypothetical protein
MNEKKNARVNNLFALDYAEGIPIQKNSGGSYEPKQQIWVGRHAGPVAPGITPPKVEEKTSSPTMDSDPISPGGPTDTITGSDADEVEGADYC